MRSFLIVLGIGFILVGCATLPPIPPEKSNYEKVYTTSLPKNVVFSKGLEWIAKTFKSAKAVIEFQDKDAGKIIGNGITNILVGPMRVSIPIYFTMTLEAKEGKYRMVFDNVQRGDNVNAMNQALGGNRPDEWVPGSFYRAEEIKLAHLKLQSFCDDFQKYLNAKQEEW